MRMAESFGDDKLLICCIISPDTGNVLLIENVLVPLHCI